MLKTDNLHIYWANILAGPELYVIIYNMHLRTTQSTYLYSGTVKCRMQNNILRLTDLSFEMLFFHQWIWNPVKHQSLRPQYLLCF